MKDPLEAIVEVLREGVPAVVAVVIGTRGSTPGKETMRMVVREDGGMVGTVGGGCVEADVRDAAMGVLADGACRLVSFDLVEETSAGRSGLLCGGTVEVLLRPLAPDPVWAEALERRDRGGRVALVTPVDAGEPPSALALVAEDGTPAGGDPDLAAAAAEAASAALEDDAARRATLSIAGVALDVFVEPVARPMVWIHGGGHVSLELAEIAARAGFRVGVTDDRVEFANPRRFPMASRTVAGAFPGCLDRMPAGPRDHHVIVTRGHHQDETVLRWAVARPAASIGMIGSRRKIRTIFDRLRAEGVPEATLARVRAPVGLHVGAVTASEIAVAIAAELVAIRRLGGDADGVGVPLYSGQKSVSPPPGPPTMRGSRNT